MSKIRPYKHKNICFKDEEFAEGVSSDNYYLRNVVNTFPRLYDIYEGKIPYIPQDFPVLVSMFEQLYKGVAYELRSLHPDNIKLHDMVFESGHRFTRFLDVIDKHIPISDSEAGRDHVIEKLEELEDLYTPSRFSIHKSFPEFQQSFRRFENTLFRMQKGLELEYSKSSITEEEERDLEEF